MNLKVLKIFVLTNTSQSPNAKEDLLAPTANPNAEKYMLSEASTLVSTFIWETANTVLTASSPTLSRDKSSSQSLLKKFAGNFTMRTTAPRATSAASHMISELKPAFTILWGNANFQLIHADFHIRKR